MGKKTRLYCRPTVFEIHKYTHPIECLDIDYRIEISGGAYTAGGFVWCDRPLYLVKQPQEKWVCDFHDNALPLSFQLQVAEVIF